MTYRVLSLFAGIGGFDLGLERTNGFKTVAFCEIDPFCQKVLAKHWPGVPCYDDVRTLTAERLAADGIAVDAIVGGFPCQPFSTASRGRRVATDLWPEMLRIVGDVRPRYVVAENVARSPIIKAKVQLDDIGYSAIVHPISAADVGADHTRVRWWLCAHPYNEGELHRFFDAEVARLSEIRGSVWQRPYQPERLRVSDGVPARVDRLKSLGNAVVPQIPELIGRAILAADAERLAA